jgi:3-deoxy-D-manno-octulosonate 8-phosphate phosphatase (KDO 8-P phosphatase)
MRMELKEINQRAAGIKLLVLDVDGVLTDGRVVYDHQGNEIKFFDVRDGHRLKLLERAGLGCVWLSGRKSAANQVRAKELGAAELIEDCKIKLPALEELVYRRGLAMEQVAYMGDDLIDLPCLRVVGLAMAPADAIEEVREIAHWIAPFPGGRGAVGAGVELLLKSTDAWEKVTARYY